MRILLVEDDPGLGSALRDHLGAEGHTPDWVRTLADATHVAASVSYDIVLLDLMLPDGQGLDFLHSYRRTDKTVPVIILTARDRITERIAGLNAGADDYLVKPFNLAELSARIGAVSRRYAGTPNPLFRLGALSVDLAKRSVVGPNGPVTLTRREWIILELLLSRPGQLIDKPMLETRLYSFDAEVESNTIEVYVSRLRKKLGADVIETQRGLGYRIVST